MKLSRDLEMALVIAFLSGLLVLVSGQQLGPAPAGGQQGVCEAHLRCGETTQQEYNAANGDPGRQCRALYNGLACLKSSQCPPDQARGVPEAVSFAERELQQLNCTRTGAGGAGGRDNGLFGGAGNSLACSVSLLILVALMTLLNIIIR